MAGFLVVMGAAAVCMALVSRAVHCSFNYHGNSPVAAGGMTFARHPCSRFFEQGVGIGLYSSGLYTAQPVFVPVHHALFLMYVSWFDKC